MYEPQDGEFLFANAFNSVVQALNGTAVFSGCAVSVNSGSLGQGDTLSVDAGTVAVDGSTVSVSSVKIGVDAGSSDGPRYDIVVVGTDGAVDVVKGSPDTSSEPTPTAPAIPADHALIAFVRVPEGASSIDGSNLNGGRAVVEKFAGRSAVFEVTGEFTDPGGISYTGAINPINVTDETVTFNESEVSLSATTSSLDKDEVVLSNESLELGDAEGEDGSIVSRPANDSSYGGYSDKMGVVVNPNTDLYGVHGLVVSGTSGITEAQLMDSSNNVLDKTSASSGSTITLYADMSAGNDYYVIAWAEGSNYTYERTTGDTSYSSTDVDIVDGYDGGTIRDDQYRNVNDIQAILPAPSTSGSAWVEWSKPSDIRSWDIATWQRSLKGETVTINVEDGSGNVLFSDIGQNFDISTVDTGKNVRFRVDLSRSDTSNNPTIDYLARRYER